MKRTYESVEWFRFQYANDTFSVAYTSPEALWSATFAGNHTSPMLKRTVTTTTETTDWEEVGK